VMKFDASRAFFARIIHRMGEEAGIEAH
jgi:hypothetical protein